MSKHKDKDKERNKESRDRDRSRDRDHRKRSRDRSKERRHKKSKDRSKRSRSRKSSRRDRSRSREYTRRSRSKESRRSRSRERARKRSPSPPRASTSHQKIEISPAQQAQISQFITASLSGFSGLASQPSTTIPALAQLQFHQQPEPVLRTDFSNLFQSSTSSSVTTGPNSSALAIAAAKAKDLLKAKNLTETIKTTISNGNSVTSNGNESSHDGEAFRAVLDSAENSVSGTGDASNSEDRRKKKKSRWATSNDGTEGKIFIPGMPTILPSNLNPDQQEAYLVQLQIEEISRKLRTGDLGVPLNPEERSPSPEPIYSSDGKRLNTREFRTRKKLEEQRHMLITRMQCMNPDFKPPADYKPPVTRVSDKVLIPQEEHPEINFVGLLIGPRGNTLKSMEKETGAKIIIRGKGSVKEGKVGRKDGQPLPGEDEPLHAFITANNIESVKKAVDKIKEVIKQGIEVPEGCNDLRRMQLRELAQLNGTLRETDTSRCTNCGSTEHKSWLCQDKLNVTNSIMCSACGGTGHIAKDCKSKRPGLGGIESANNQAKIDEEYMSLMAELGEVPIVAEQPPPPVREPLPPAPKPYNIFDNPKHHQPMQPPSQSRPPPMPMPPNNVPPVPIPPPWQMNNQNQHPIPPPLPMNNQFQQNWSPLSWPPPAFPPMPNAIPPPPKSMDEHDFDLAPPGTMPVFDDDRFGKKPFANTSWPNPMPPQPPLPTSLNFMVPPPPPEPPGE